MHPMSTGWKKLNKLFMQTMINLLSQFTGHDIIQTSPFSLISRVVVR